MDILKSRKRYLVFILAVMMVVVSAMPCFAATKEAKLKVGDWVATSGSAEGNYAKISGGYVELSSDLPVWFVIESNKGGYHDVAKEKVGVGKSPTGVSYKGETTNYRLELNPYGTGTTGCVANGSIYITTK